MTRASDLAKLLGAGATILDGTTISTADNTDQLTLLSTDADANVGPNLNLFRNSGSPADDDVLGLIIYNGRNDNSQDVIYARQVSYIKDASDGTEDGQLSLQTMVAGTIRDRLNITPTEIVLNEESIDSDFRVESNGNANMLFVDGGNDKVGIGTNSPSVLLDLESTSPTIKLTDSDASGTPECEISGAGGDLTLRADKDNEKASSLISFEVDGTERTRVQANGAFQVKVNNASYDTWSNNLDACQINSDIADKVTFSVNAQITSFSNDVQRLLCDRTANSAYEFLTCTSGNLGDDEFRLRGDGNAYADGSWNGGGADYAEYFEWADGNTDSEDRRGYTVVLDNNKIRKATSDDDASIIIGVISGNPSMVGDSDVGQWKYKYQKDDYGTYILDENGDRVLNTNYDETQEYVSRENRQEWDTVGLMGKLRIRKNQPTGSNWIKMRDVSETVEEWLVR
jgi:hypothetical protein